MKKTSLLVGLIFLISALPLYSNENINIYPDEIPESYLQGQYRNYDIESNNYDHQFGDLKYLATFKGQVTDLIFYGPTPSGVLVDVHNEGILNGKLNGFMKGIDYTTVRVDEVMELYVKAMIKTVDEALLSLTIKGYLINGEIKDTSVKFQTAHPKYQWLHDQIIIGKGWAFQDKIIVNYFIVR